MRAYAHIRLKIGMIEFPGGRGIVSVMPRERFRVTKLERAATHERKNRPNGCVFVRAAKAHR